MRGSQDDVADAEYKATIPMPNAQLARKAREVLRRQAPANFIIRDRDGKRAYRLDLPLPERAFYASMLEPYARGADTELPAGEIEGEMECNVEAVTEHQVERVPTCTLEQFQHLNHTAKIQEPSWTSKRPSTVHRGTPMSQSGTSESTAKGQRTCMTRYTAMTANCHHNREETTNNQPVHSARTSKSLLGRAMKWGELNGKKPHEPKIGIASQPQ